METVLETPVMGMQMVMESSTNKTTVQLFQTLIRTILMLTKWEMYAITVLFNFFDNEMYNNYFFKLK